MKKVYIAALLFALFFNNAQASQKAALQQVFRMYAYLNSVSPSWIKSKHVIAGSIFAGQSYLIYDLQQKNNRYLDHIDECSYNSSKVVSDCLSEYNKAKLELSIQAKNSSDHHYRVWNLMRDHIDKSRRGLDCSKEQCIAELKKETEKLQDYSSTFEGKISVLEARNLELLQRLDKLEKWKKSRWV